MSAAVDVVVTGLGAVTPLGGDVATTWRRLVAGDSAAAPLTLFDVSGCRCRQAAAAELPDLPLWPAARLRRLSRASRLALPAIHEALRQARLTPTVLPISVSTTGGGMAFGEQFMRAIRGGVSARSRDQFFRVARYPAQQQMLDAQAAFGFRGPITIIANACASGGNAIGHARDLIRSGAAECVLTGGYEALTELIYVGFDCLQALSVEQCRPFDTGRSGLLLGEAAAFLVVESAPHARARGATILAGVAGCGHATDLHHLTQPQPTGQTELRVMRHALAEAGLTPGDIGYLNAHGTGTALNDASECAAFAALFAGNPATRISSTKAAIGHTLGAAGAIEAVFAIQALRTGQLPPQLNLRAPEPAVAGQLVAPGERLPAGRATLSVNLGFGGSNAALVFAAAPPATARPRAKSASPAPRILGCGAVTAAGVGVAELVARQPLPIPTTSYGGIEYSAYRVDLTHPRLKELALHPRLRRASPIALFMVAAAQAAIAEAGGVDADRLGIVAAFGSGPLIASRRFYEGILKSGQRFAAPNLFPETVYNSATSHVAAALGCGGPAYSVVGDRSAWVNALGIARRWLADGGVDRVVVIGAEELDPLILDVYRAAGWLKPSTAFVAGEGAAAVLLGRDGNMGVALPALTEGHTFRSWTAARAAAVASMAALGEFKTVFPTSTHNRWGRFERELIAARGWAPAPAGPYCGEAFTATPAWQTVQAIQQARAGATTIAVPVWGLNEQCGGLVVAGG